jgi:hypothetical protein
MKFVSVSAGAGLMLGVTACVSPQRQAAQKEDLLAAAVSGQSCGYHALDGDGGLPPNKFVTRVVNGQPVYLYHPTRWSADQSPFTADSQGGPPTVRRSSPSSSPKRGPDDRDE